MSKDSPGSARIAAQEAIVNWLPGRRLGAIFRLARRPSAGRPGLLIVVARAWRELLAPVPLLVITTVYACAEFGHVFVPWFDREVLGHILQLEALVLFGGLFLIFPLLAPARTPGRQWLRRAVFLALAVVLAVAASDYGGARGVFGYVVLVYITFGRGILSAGIHCAVGSGESLVCTLRWLFSLVVFLVTITVFGVARISADEWIFDADVPLAGAAYFGVLLAVEMLIAFRALWKVRQY